MRTTLSLDDDALAAIRAYARTRHISLSKAASELIHRGARYQLSTRTVNGLPVLSAPAYFPIITTKQVRALLNRE